MKIAHKLMAASALLLIAGCSSHHEKQASYNEPHYSSWTPGTSATGGSWSSNQGATSANPSQTTTSGIGSQNVQVNQVQQQLSQDPTLAPLVPNLQISFANGTLTLAGTVPSEQEKQKIESIVKSTSGVVNVNNQLRVSAQSSLTQPGENKEAVGGTADQSGTSQLTGKQSSDPSALKAPDTAASDTSASNQQTPATVSANPSKSPTDQSATDASAKASQDQSLTPTSDTDAARSYGGTQLKIQGTTQADKTLGQQIAQELKNDTTLAPMLARIKINVDNGKVTVRGNVKSDEQKAKIESAIQKVTGVANVENQLQVNATGSQTEPTPAPTSDSNKEAAPEPNKDSTPDNK